MTLNQLIQFLSPVNLNLLGVVKVMFLIGLFIYFAFAVIVVRQVRMMSQVLSGVLEGLLNLIAWIHLAAAVFVFALAWLIL